MATEHVASERKTLKFRDLLSFDIPGILYKIHSPAAVWRVSQMRIGPTGLAETGRTMPMDNNRSSGQSSLSRRVGKGHLKECTSQ